MLRIYKNGKLQGGGEVEEKEYLESSDFKHRQKLGQFMTPMKDVNNAFRDIPININDKVLEPSYGTGNFLDGIIKRGYKNITGVEFDSELYNKFKSKYEKKGVKCINGDYLMTDLTNQMDLIIGNPPYFNYGQADHPKLPPEIKKKYKDVIGGVVDIYGLFCVKAVMDLKVGGICCYYIPSTILNTKNFTKIRNFLHENVNIERCEAVKDKDFKETKVSNLMMFQFKKTQPTNDYTYKVGKNLYFSFEKTPKGKILNVEEGVERVGDLCKFRSGNYEFDKIKHIKDAFSDKLIKGSVPLIFGENLRDNNTIDLNKKLKGIRKQYMIKDKFKVPTQAPILLTRRSIGASKICPFVLYEKGELYVENHCLYAVGELKNLKRVQKALNNPEYKKEYLDTIKGRSISTTFLNELPVDKDDFEELFVETKQKMTKLNEEYNQHLKEFRPNIDVMMKKYKNVI